eukprot:TRINITY_DN38363_c0_g1_i1.p1 TRINITY_DN38363_c0_g1~~TRINITY_DN38363_c0_g1_i1.p1  ORF type:complete len:470 (+),score=48.84 TRINITY_DN38363_c0_g1_i1:56-1465(+)
MLGCLFLNKYNETWKADLKLQLSWNLLRSTCFALPFGGIFFSPFPNFFLRLFKCRSIECRCCRQKFGYRMEHIIQHPLQLRQNAACENESEEDNETHLEIEVCNTNPNIFDQSTYLDPEIWCNLPSDAVYRILTHLPISSLFKYKILCKKFYNIISSGSFLNIATDLQPKDHWLAVLLAGSSSQFHCFDPVFNKWRVFSLSFLPFNVRGLASAGGLFCCRAEISGSLSLVICNPISKNWIVLPPILKKRVVPIVSLLICEKNFKVLVAGDDLLPDRRNVRDLSYELYDYATNTWTLCGPLPPQTDLEFGFAACNGNLYFINYLPYGPYGVVNFNLQLCVWTKVEAPMPKNLTIPCLVECCGRLFIVGGVLKKNSLSSIRVWELCDEEKTWKEFARMKDKMFKELPSGMGEFFFNAVSNGGVIYLVYKASQMLAFDVCTRTWRWLPEHPIAGVLELPGYSFSPRMWTLID